MVQILKILKIYYLDKFKVRPISLIFVNTILVANWGFRINIKILKIFYFNARYVSKPKRVCFKTTANSVLKEFQNVKYHLIPVDSYRKCLPP